MAIDACSKGADLSCSVGDPQIFTFFAPGPMNPLEET